MLFGKFCRFFQLFNWDRVFFEQKGKCEATFLVTSHNIFVHFYYCQIKIGYPLFILFVSSLKLVPNVVAKFFNIKVTDLTSDKRSTTIAFPRQIAMYLCREVADMSFPAIGKDFGGRDHSTVLHAYSKVKYDYDNNPDTKDLIDDIKKTLERES